ncbi:FG-GAP repeat protein [Streptomyces sp. NPDC090306]|uniref:FG-GAP repeat protein n=1 Tax=unclassified Streptomyces TaxID=2593676 RepID=UPI0036E1D189
MHQHLRTALATATAAALTGGLLTLAATAPAAAADAVTHPVADFNGDGIGDVAYSAPTSTVAGHKYAGNLVVMYGSATGINGVNRKTINYNTAAVAGTPGTGDEFGALSAVGDFDDDGYDDLAVTAPWKSVGGHARAGMVTLLWGSPGGLTGGTTLADPSSAANRQWGQAVAAGDFDGDGKDDLAVGADAASVWVFKKGISRKGVAVARGTVKAPIVAGGGSGPLSLTAGDVTGDHRTDLVVDGYDPKTAQQWNANYFIPGTASGLNAAAAVKLAPGVITGIADVNKDGRGDIVTGMSWDPSTGVPGAVTGGKVTIRYGSSSGPAGTTAISQNTGNVPGGSETGDGFGSELSLGDVNGDGYADLAVGSWGEDLGTAKDTGAVTVLYGSASGIDTSSGAQYFDQDTAGVPDTNESNDLFGCEIKLTDVTGDGRADLTVGDCDENTNGAVFYLPSNGTKITATGSREIFASSVGVDADGHPYFGMNAAD